MRKRRRRIRASCRTTWTKTYIDAGCYTNLLREIEHTVSILPREAKKIKHDRYFPHGLAR